MRDRSFFFFSYEGQRVRRSLTRTFSVPTQAVRSGDFSGVAQICDPVTINPTTGACTPFAGNRIPADRIDPLAAAFLQHVPQPTSDATLQNLTAVGKQVKDVDQISLRVDHRFTSGDQLFARFSTFDASEIQPFGTSSLQETLVPGFGRDVGTKARNLGISHTHLFGRSAVNELRFGWMRVTGGQVSENRGVDFARQVGLQGVTTDPRDVGFPQISTRGLYSTFGDPTSFVYRDNQHFELYDNVIFDRGAHRLKVGAYYFHLQFRPEQPDNARGAFTYTGQFSGNAFADFLLGYPTSAVAGIGRGDQDGRTNWLHLFAQDDWRIRRNLTINVGLRYEYNQHMRDENNRLSSVDYVTPGGRFVIASDENGNINPEAASLLPLIPIPYVTSQEAGWERGLLSPSKVRLAPRTGFALSLNDDRAVVRGGYGIFLNQWAYSVQTAFSRNLPFFFTRQVDVPSDRRVPVFQTRNILTSDPTGVVAPSIMDHAYAVEYTQTWSGGLQYQLLPATMVEASYMGSWTLGADNATVHNVPEPGPGSIQARRPIPQLGAIRSIRFDGKSIYHGVTFKAEQRLRSSYSYSVSYTLSTSKDDASSPGPTEAETNFPQNVRNIFDETGEWASSSFDHRHLVRGQWHVPIAVLRRGRRRAGGTARRLACQRGLFCAVGCAVHRQPRRRPGEYRRGSIATAGSAAGSQPAGERAHDQSGGSTRPRLRCRRRSRLGMRLGTVSSALDSRTWILRWRRRGPWRGVGSWSSDGKCSTSSIRQTSICRTGSSGRPTSVASSARRIRVRCNSGRRSVSRSGFKTFARVLSPIFLCPSSGRQARVRETALRGGQRKIGATRAVSVLKPLLVASTSCRTLFASGMAVTSSSVDEFAADRLTIGKPSASAYFAIVGAQSGASTA